MDSSLIERVAALAAKRNALVFLDLQVGQSNLRDELPRLAGFLSRPNFHLGIDPEFSMKDGTPPGKKVGTFDAADVNYASAFLADLVAKHSLTPKVLVVHRFTQHGVTNTKKITLDPRVQIVMDMDGSLGPRPDLEEETHSESGSKPSRCSLRGGNSSTNRGTIHRARRSPRFCGRHSAAALASNHQ